MKKKTAVAVFIMVEDVSVFVVADVHSLDERFAFYDIDIGIFEVDLSLADRLDFGAAKFHAGFIKLLQEIIMAGFMEG